MKIAICDDDSKAMLRIQQYVNEYINSSLLEVRVGVFAFKNSEELLNQVENGCWFDMYLLDVIMPNINGIELAMKIRKIDQVAKIIFLTASSEFAVKSYSVSAFDYLLKPVKRVTLFSVLEKAYNEINDKLNEYILIKTQNGFSKLLFHEIIYIEVIDRVIYFYQKSGLIAESNTTIAKVEGALLADNRFIKPHRSYIVNLQYVMTLEKGGFIMTNNQFIPIARATFKEVKQSFLNYLNS